MTTRWLTLFALAVFPGCIDLAAIMGREEIVTQSDSLQGPPAITDDRIEDKHPVFDESLTIVENFGSCDATLNKSGSVTKLDVLPPDAAHEAALDKLYPSYGAAAEAFSGQLMVPSMEVVQGMLKPFNDGLYAAVELAAQDASGGATMSKSQLLKDLLSEMVTRATSGTASEQPLASESAAFLAAAIRAGGGTATVPAQIDSTATSILAAFDADPAHSRPIGFYTWSPALEGVFRQDRLLQGTPSFGAVAAMAVALNARSDLRQSYGGVLDLYARLTNPYFDYPLTAVMPFATDASALGDVNSVRTAFQAANPLTCGRTTAVLPASDSAESRLFRDLECSNSLPEGNLIDILINAIRSGTIDLTPKADSGWYDRQIYALETLLVTDKAAEKDHLFLTKRYKEKLIETFKTIITQNRETHVKQSETGFGGEAVSSDEPIEFDVYPKLPVEPFPTFYLRTAQGYLFLRSALQATMGDNFLAATHRLMEDGSRSPLSLAAELDTMIRRLYGFHVVAAASIGMRGWMSAEEKAAFTEKECEAEARTWLKTWTDDSDVSRDQRVIVPVEVTAAGVRYWAVVGVRGFRIETSFYPGYEPTVQSRTVGCIFRSFITAQPLLFVGKMVEVTMPRSKQPPTRAEFRQICDQAGTVEAIVAALQGS